MCMERDYRVFLLEISRQITPDQLSEIKFLCADFIPELHREKLTVLEFFRELERQERLGIDRLDCLIHLFEHVRRQDLARKLRDFQNIRSAYLCELNSGTTGALSHEVRYSQAVPPMHNVTPPRDTPPPSDSREPGEITIKCIFKMASVGAWLAGTTYILSRYREDPASLATVMTTVVLPYGFMLKYMTSGSVKIVVWTADLQALQELWNRYESGQLYKEMEKELITEELKKLAGGEEIELTVEIDEYEYKNACLDLIVARNKATRIVSTLARLGPSRAKSLQDITSPLILPIPSKHGPPSPEKPKDLRLSPCHIIKPLSQLTKESSSSSGFCSSIGSTGEESTLLSEFLLYNSKVHDICGTLDREMILCHDWRSLASKYCYKMNAIRLLQRKDSPTLALLQDVASKSPETKLSNLIDKLSELERDDIVDHIIDGNDNNDPRAILNMPFDVRKDFTLELDYATLSQFTEVVHRIIKTIRPSEIAALQKRSSPSMSLLEELETVFPEMDVIHLQNACQEGGVHAASQVLTDYITSITPKQRSSTVRRKESLQRLRQIGGDSGLGLSSPQSPTQEEPRGHLGFPKT